jgi:hypothetical protein
VSKVISGKVVDGYIAGATVTMDLNDDRICSANEPKAQTNGLGGYSFTAAQNTNNGDHMVCASGGVDVSSGNAVIGELKAPAGSTVVTALTSLVQAAVDAQLPAPVLGTASPVPAATVTSATATVATSLNLPGVALISTDPVTSSNANVIKVTAAVQTMLSSTSTAIAGVVAPGNEALKNAVFQNAVKSTMAAVTANPLSPARTLSSLSQIVAGGTVSRAATDTAVTSLAPTVVQLAPASVASFVAPTIGAAVTAVGSASQASLGSATTIAGNPAAKAATDALLLAQSASLAAPLLTTAVANANPTFGVAGANNPLTTLATAVQTNLANTATVANVNDAINAVIAASAAPPGTEIPTVSDAAATAAAAARLAAEAAARAAAEAARVAAGITGGT